MQTALQWLSEQIEYNRIEMPITFNIVFEQAFEREEQQIILAWENGSLPSMLKEHKCSRDYFEQTYKNHGDETF